MEETPKPVTENWRPPDGHPITVGRAKALLADELGDLYRDILKASCVTMYWFSLRSRLHTAGHYRTRPKIEADGVFGRHSSTASRPTASTSIWRRGKTTRISKYKCAIGVVGPARMANGRMRNSHADCRPSLEMTPAMLKDHAAVAKASLWPLRAPTGAQR